MIEHLMFVILYKQSVEGCEAWGTRNKEMNETLLSMCDIVSEQYSIHLTVISPYSQDFVIVQVFTTAV